MTGFPPPINGVSPLKNRNLLVSYAMNPFALINNHLQQSPLLDFNDIEYPYASAFHLAFKIMLLFSYLLLPIFVGNATI
jgi:hypothetical protein